MRLKVTPNAMQAAIERQQRMLMRLRAVREELRSTISMMRLMSPLDQNTEAIRRLNRKLDRIDDTIKVLTDMLRRITQTYQQYEMRSALKTAQVIMRFTEGRFVQLDPLAFRGIQLN